MEQTKAMCVFRLSTGEDVITEYKYKKKSDSFIFINPLRITYYHDTSNGKLVVGLVPWIFRSISRDYKILVPCKDIIIMVNPTEHLITHYEETLGTLVKSPKEIENQSEQHLKDLLNAVTPVVPGKNDTVH